jgi:hypothetical protein
MKKDKLFIILIITIAALVFTTAQICNQCGITPAQETIEDVADENRTDTGQATGDEEQQVEQTSETMQETSEETMESEDVEETTSETDQEVSEEERMEDIPEPTIETLRPIGNETGCVSADRSQVVIYYILAGHSEDGKDYRGFISFDISHLSPENIIDFAELSLLNPQIFEPRTQLRDFRIGVLEYGAGPLSGSAIGLPGTPIASLANTTSDVNLNNDKLITELQSAVDRGEIRFQITLYWSHPEGYVDFATHGNVYLKEDVSLLITYF